MTEAELKRDDPIPLDDNRLFFLSLFRNDEGEIEKASIDVEKASDSHYELSVEGLRRLEVYLMEKFHKGDIVAGLKEFLRRNNESDLVGLLDRLGVDYQPFHFDDYDW